MIELENDRRIYTLLEQVIRLEEEMRKRHAAAPSDEPGEIDHRANEVLDKLDSELERLIEQDVLVDESVDEILEAVRADVRALVEHHHSEDRDDSKIRKLARAIRARIEKDRKALEKGERADASETSAPKLAHEMLDALKEKDASFDVDAELIRKISASLRRILEEERGI